MGGRQPRAVGGVVALTMWRSGLWPAAFILSHRRCPPVVFIFSPKCVRPPPHPDPTLFRSATRHLQKHTDAPSCRLQLIVVLNEDGAGLRMKTFLSGHQAQTEPRSDCRCVLHVIHHSPLTGPRRLLAPVCLTDGYANEKRQEIISLKSLGVQSGTMSGVKV